MANNIFTNKLNNIELMDAFGIKQDNAPLTPEELAALSEQQEIVEPVPIIQEQKPVMPSKTAEIKPKEVITEPSAINTAMNALSNWENRPKTTEYSNSITNQTEAPMSKSEALMAEYRKMMGEDQQKLEEARRQDRMFKVGGALGDALATYINARGQMNVKAPGVQVPQGAGLDKIANIFATSPDIASDIAQRRASLLKEYEELARGERAEAKAQTQKEIANEKNRIAEERNRLFGQQVAKMGSGREEAREFRERVYEENKIKDLQNSFNRDKQVVKAEERIQSAATLRDMISGNPITQEAAKTFAARASGEVGALSDQDRAAYGGSKAILDRINSIATRAVSGELTDTDKKFMNELADKFEAAGKRDLEARLNVYSKQGTKRTKMNEDEVKEIIRPDLVLQQKEESSKLNLSPKDQQALDWANKNPNDPRSIQIKKKLGM